MEKQSKHELYTGTQSEFRKMIKYIDKEFIVNLHKSGKLNEVAKAVQDTVKSIGSIPRICNEACDIKDSCPFYLNGSIPEGSHCPIESYIIDHISTDLQLELIKDRDITTSDMMSISSLLILYILSHRLSNRITIDGLTTVGVTKTQSGFTETQITNPMIKDLLDVQLEMQKILKNLHLLRIERSKHQPIKKSVDKSKGLNITNIYNKLKEKGIDPKILSEIMQEAIDEK